MMFNLKRKRRTPMETAEGLLPKAGMHCWHRPVGAAAAWTMPLGDASVSANRPEPDMACCRCGAVAKDVRAPFPGHGPHAPVGHTRAYYDFDVVAPCTGAVPSSGTPG